MFNFIERKSKGTLKNICRKTFTEIYLLYIQSLIKIEMIFNDLESIKNI